MGLLLFALRLFLLLALGLLLFALRLFLLLALRLLLLALRAFLGLLLITLRALRVAVQWRDATLGRGCRRLARRCSHGIAAEVGPHDGRALGGLLLLAFAWLARRIGSSRHGRGGHGRRHRGPRLLAAAREHVVARRQHGLRLRDDRRPTDGIGVHAHERLLHRTLLDQRTPVRDRHAPFARVFAPALAVVAIGRRSHDDVHPLHVRGACLEPRVIAVPRGERIPAHRRTCR